MLRVAVLRVAKLAFAETRTRSEAFGPMEIRMADVGPLVLMPDNFTPPQRTPWGGHRIARVYKAGLVDPSSMVGESWEVSVEPDFPATVDGGATGQPALHGTPLAEVLSSAPDQWLGAQASLGGSPLLVKLLDTADPLSVQIHPADGDPSLSALQSGKPEAWFILHAEPEAGIYLGLRQGVTETSLRGAVESDEDVSSLLCFVAVEPGDFFVIEAGTPHAIGPGLTLIEPQRVLPGKRGVTYRYWDWNRRYDACGQPDPEGAARQLHLDAALKVTRWDQPRGEALLSRARLCTGPLQAEAPARSQLLCGPRLAPSDALCSDALEVSLLTGSGPVSLPRTAHLRSITVAQGTVVVGGVPVRSGRSAVVPPGTDWRCELSNAWALVAAALTPAHASSASTE